MAKTVYAFKLGTRNLYGLTHNKLGSNLPADTWDKWRPFKGASGKLGLPDATMTELNSEGFCLMRGLKIVAVRSGELARPARKKK